MNAPINRDFQFVTQKFKPGHRGVDLRCVDDKTHKNLDVCATEKSELIRQGVDGYGNHYMVLKPLENSGLTDIKYIHLEATAYKIGTVFEAGEAFAKCSLGGNSPSLHLHFETWFNNKPLDPLVYLGRMNIEYKIKPGA